MFNFKLSEKELNYLIDYSYSLVKQNWKEQYFQETLEKWKTILYSEVAKSILVSPSGEQLFPQEVTIGQLRFELIFDTGRIKTLAAKHLPIHTFSNDKFVLPRIAPSIPKFVYQKEEVLPDYPKNNDPIIIVPIAIHPSYLGFTIDGNHRVNFSIKYSHEPIKAYICNEQMACIALLSYFQRALYLFIQEISEILSLNYPQINNYRSNRIILFEGFLKNRK